MGIKTGLKRRKYKKKLQKNQDFNTTGETRSRIYLIAGLFLVMLILIAFNYYNRERFLNWKNIDRNFTLFFIINLNVLVLAVLSVLLVRYILKLIYESRRKIGFRLKIKLSFVLMVAGGFPTLAFFFIANGYLTDNLNYWFQGQFALALKKSASSIEKVQEDNETEIIHFGKNIIKALPPQKIKPSEKERFFQNKLEEYLLNGIVLRDENFNSLIEVFKKDFSTEKYKTLKKISDISSDFSQPVILNELSEEEFFYRSLHKISDGTSTQYLEILKSDRAVSSIYLENVLLTLEDALGLLEFERLVAINYRVYLFIFTIISLSIFVWFGMYLARKIMAPVGVLMDASEKIAKGEFDFTLDRSSDGEMEELMKSFNTMLEDLKTSRIDLEHNRQELLKTNKILAEQNTVTRTILDNIQTGVFSIDNLGYVKKVNPYMQKFLQIKSAEATESHYMNLMSREQIEILQTLKNKLYQSDTDNIREESSISIGRQSKRASFHLFRLKAENNSQTGFLLVVHDMTDLDRTTRARAWSDIARRIAHEIKNPLTPIQLSAERIYRFYKEKVSEKEPLKTCTETIIAEVEGIKSMVNEFSQFARLPETHMETTNMNTIAQEVANLFEPSMPSEISLILELEEKLPPLRIDRAQIKRVFTNLLDNAVAAFEEQRGTITIRTSLSKEGDTIHAEVSDNGKGISEKLLGEIFEPYVTTKKEGTGLGLAIVNRIISDHQGNIEVHSKEKKGTDFTIDLPIGRRV